MEHLKKWSTLANEQKIVSVCVCVCISCKETFSCLFWSLTSGLNHSRRAFSTTFAPVVNPARKPTMRIILFSILVNKALIVSILERMWHLWTAAELITSLVTVDSVHKEFGTFDLADVQPSVVLSNQVLERMSFVTGRRRPWTPSAWCRRPSTTPSCWASWEMCSGSCRPLFGWRSC